MTSRTIRLAAALAVIAALSACTTAADGTPRPVPGGETPDTSTSSSSPTSTSDEAPRVASPLDADAFVAEPCSSLTDEQLTSFNVGEGKPQGGENLPPGCGWFGDSGAISVGWLAQNKNGLADTYRRKELDAYFIETTVDGYPAVFADATDERSTGVCGIVVGVSDTMTFYAQVSDGPVGDAACDKAEQVASATLTTVKAGS
jgi:hypothetical protein